MSELSHYENLEIQMQVFMLLASTNYAISPAPGNMVFQFYFFIIYLFYVHEYFACISAAFLVPAEAIKWCWISCNWSYRRLPAIWWLGIESESSGRAINGLK